MIRNGMPFVICQKLDRWRLTEDRAKALAVNLQGKLASASQ
jgi:hypothetical protein